MDHHPTRMCMGLWLLALRTVDTEDKSQCWFVVNGVPIRYSIREHGLLSGLHCHNFPGRLEDLGSKKFWRRQFGKRRPEVKEVLQKLLSMKKERESRVRLKLAVLYFLAMVIRGLHKYPGPVDELLLRMVSDLDLCKTFPWGRLTYDDCVKQVYKMVKKHKNGVKLGHCFPGFILPLEVLAFECIQPLKSMFRDVVEPKTPRCPILCRGKFKKSLGKGFSLQELYDALGDSKSIKSTLVHEGDEEEEDAHIAPHELYVGNPLVDAWNRFLTRNGSIFWEDFYQIDIDARAIQDAPDVHEADPVPPPGNPVPPIAPLANPVPLLADLVPPAANPVPPSANLVPPAANPVPPAANPIPPPVAEALAGFMKMFEERFQKLDEKLDSKMLDMSTNLKAMEDRLRKGDGEGECAKVGDGDEGDRDGGEGEGYGGEGYGGEGYGGEGEDYGDEGGLDGGAKVSLDDGDEGGIDGGAKDSSDEGVKDSSDAQDLGEGYGAEGDLGGSLDERASDSLDEGAKDSSDPEDLSRALVIYQPVAGPVPPAKDPVPPAEDPVPPAATTVPPAEDPVPLVPPGVIVGLSAEAGPSGRRGRKRNPSFRKKSPYTEGKKKKRKE